MQQQALGLELRTRAAVGQGGARAGGARRHRPGRACGFSLSEEERTREAERRGGAVWPIVLTGSPRLVLEDEGGSRGPQRGAVTITQTRPVGGVEQGGEVGVTVPGFQTVGEEATGFVDGLDVR